MAEEPKPKRTRKPRRNFQRELSDLRTYCKVSLEVLKEDLNETGADPKLNAKVETFEKILARIPE